MNTTTHWLKTGALAVALVVVAGCGLGAVQQLRPAGAPASAPPAAPALPAATAAPPPPPAPAAVGVPVVAGNWEYTVVGTQRQKEIKAKFTGSAAKGEYVVVGVRVKNVGRENFGLNAHDFELYDGSGVKYRPASVYVMEWAKTLGYDGVMGQDTAQMPPGVPGTYALAFDVAPDAQGLRLRLVQAKTDVAL